MITTIIICIYLVIGAIVFLHDEKDTEFIIIHELLLFMSVWPAYFLCLLFDFISNNIHKLLKFKNPFYKDKK